MACVCGLLHFEILIFRFSCLMSSSALPSLRERGEETKKKLANKRRDVEMQDYSTARILHVLESKLVLCRLTR